MCLLFHAYTPEEPNLQNLISPSYRRNMVTGPGRPGKACSICKKQKVSDLPAEDNGVTN